MKKRPSLSESATLFKKGNDGNIYTISVDKNKIHKWTQVAIVKDKNLYIKGQLISDTIKSLNVSKMKELKLYGELDVQGKLCIGDSIPHELAAFGKGRYYIYRFYDSLIASKNKLTLSKLLSTHFSNKLNINVYVDYGVFVFRDKNTSKRTQKKII